MKYMTDNLNIRELTPLTSPQEFRVQLPLDDAQARVVAQGRKNIQQILKRKKRQWMVIVGPCSLHDRDATLDYARRLQRLQKDIGPSVLLVMRAYLEKPRTTIGWKGMLYDPHLDETDDIEYGIRLSRDLLLEITRLGLPLATEILDPIVPQFLSDLISWAAIGARTAESQIHRQMASGLSMPIGFKNSTDGNMSVAIEAIKTAFSPHAFLGINSEGRASIAQTSGNPYGHVVLRGGTNNTNYQSEYVAFVEVLQKKSGISNGLVIDCSHANSYKDHTRQRVAFLDVVDQIEAGNRSIAGLMLESFIASGNQPAKAPISDLKYGVSVTDKCIGWDETEELIRRLAAVSA